MTLTWAVAAIVAVLHLATAKPPDFDPKDYNWINKWAAVGDSFTAGIGSGNLYNDQPDSKRCSRYDYTYPVLMNRVFGASVRQFTYTACSGATTADIYRQIQSLPSDLDLVVFTAGGNDMCLSSLISTCIAVGGDCQGAIDRARRNLDGIVVENIRQLLAALDNKVKKNGVVVLMSYARYFNEDTDACSNEDWTIVGLPGTRPMTRDNRRIYNDLVDRTNSVLGSIAKDFSQRGARNMKLVYADWDPWAPLSGGRFCEPGASPRARDPSNKNVMFFKFNTGKEAHGELKRRDTYMPPEAPVLLVGSDETALVVANETLAIARVRNPTSPNSANVFKRDPTDPGCPKSRIAIPDNIGMIFHPNDVGHEVMASYALEAASEGRAQAIGVPPYCPVIRDAQLTCYSDQGSKAYASGQALNQEFKRFCSDLAKNRPKVGNSEQSRRLFEGAPDEHTLVVHFPANPAGFKEEDCVGAFGRIINGCDVPVGGRNPLNWKFGGQLKNGDWQYTVNIRRVNRPFPPPDVPKQSCEGWYKFVLNAYTLYGGGWSTWDWGQKTLLPSARSCVGGGVTNWHFEYFDKPDENGYEWKAWFNTPIITNRRCFDNCKVQRNSGGPETCHCGGNGG